MIFYDDYHNNPPSKHDGLTIEQQVEEQVNMSDTNKDLCFVTCSACGSETATSNEVKINLINAELTASLLSAQAEIETLKQKLKNYELTKINEEFNKFFDFDTNDRSQVSSDSCKLFAGYIAEKAIKEIKDAGNAVVERWNSPKWKEQEHTAVFIHKLEQALSLPTDNLMLEEVGHVINNSSIGDTKFMTVKANVQQLIGTKLYVIKELK